MPNYKNEENTNPITAHENYYVHSLDMTIAHMISNEGYRHEFSQKCRGE